MQLHMFVAQVRVIDTNPETGAEGPERDMHPFAVMAESQDAAAVKVETIIRAPLRTASVIIIDMDALVGAELADALETPAQKDNN